MAKLQKSTLFRNVHKGSCCGTLIRKLIVNSDGFPACTVSSKGTPHKCPCFNKLILHLHPPVGVLKLAHSLDTMLAVLLMQFQLMVK